MNYFPENIQIKLGIYVDLLVKWMVEHWGPFFDGIAFIVRELLLNIQTFLLWIPWYVAIFAIFLLGCLSQKWKSGVIYGLMIFLVGSMGLWEEMMLTMAIVLTSVIISVIIGIPLGILAAYNQKTEAFLKPLLDAMQTMPSFVYLIPAVFFFHLGTVPAVFATIIYATPPAIRLTSLAIQGVPKEMKEAAQAFGTSTWQTLIKVELPQAFPTIMTGVNQTTMMAMSMVVTASMIGAKGLGLNVLTAINQLDIAMGFEAGISIVFLAIIIDRLTQGAANKFKHRK